MRHQDNELQSILEPARMSTETNVDHMQAVRQRMLHQARASLAHPHRAAVRWTVGLLVVVAASAAGLAATQTGRDFIRRILTPVKTSYSLNGEVDSEFGDQSMWGGGGWAEPITPEVARETRAGWAQMSALAKEGGGRLTGLLESPVLDGTGYLITHMIEYVLSDGSIKTAGAGGLTDLQTTNMRIDEILELRDSGAGAIIDERSSDIGLGRYLIRFTLADGSTIDLQTNYPPGTRAEREAIFAEARELRRKRDLTVLDPTVDVETGRAWGIVRFTLADGRAVGLVGDVPSDMLTADSTHVVTTTGGTAPPAREQDEQHSSEIAEAVRIAQEGGGRLVSLSEHANFGGTGYGVGFAVECILSSGESMCVGMSQLPDKQAANMRIDEILELRDAGAGELISEEPHRYGLGRFLTRFELSDGSTVDVETYFPPGTRAARDAIFTEVAELRAKRAFTFTDPKYDPETGRVTAEWCFTLADGRTFRDSGLVPDDMLSPDDDRVVTPAPETSTSQKP